jgi:hypothetical protein
MNRVLVGLAVAMTAVTFTSCSGVKRPALQPSSAEPGASLWERPTDLPRRDLFYGPWGVGRAPNPDATYRYVHGKHSGVNPGMTVIDPQGREWSVKQALPGGLDDEGPVEVALSRLLSAIGYHQPPVYFLPSFTLKDDWGTHTERGGRFRLKEETLKDAGPWSWQENPFVGSQPYQGLLVMLVMFNSTDLKNDNNSLYEHRDGDRLERWYTVRDIGAALGDTFWLAPLKGDPTAFERAPFIIGVNNGYVDFGTKGLYRNLVQNRITPADVQWASNLLAQLSDRQWSDAFRAGGYQPDVATRFIHKLHEKVAQGRDLSRRAAAE